jgi:hypothetical protein
LVLINRLAGTQELFQGRPGSGLWRAGRRIGLSLTQD